jgi:indole-3-glycerol phosphate synthase
MSLLEEIVQLKKQEVNQNRRIRPIKMLNEMPFFNTECRSLSKEIRNGSGVIAEYKKKSPSAGEINQKSLETVLSEYRTEDISAVSILTDEFYFGGKIENLTIAKEKINRPILRKEFIIDEYQIFEAKAYGADAILLIAEILDDYHAKHLTVVAQSLGLEVLMEFHSEKELLKVNELVDIIGINNRNLDTLETDLNSSFQMINRLPKDALKIAESGISNPDQISQLYEVGFEGCLIGESVLKNEELLSRLIESALATKLSTHEN